jgi:hypothetical protein
MSYKHYCKNCKKMVPHAPGLDIMRRFTVGV